MSRKVMIIGSLGLLAATGLVVYSLCSSTLFQSGVKDVHEEALESLVPESAMLVATIDLAWLLEQFIDHNLGLFEGADSAALREELSAASKEYFGIDLIRAETGVLWVVPDDEPGANEVHVALVISANFDGSLTGETLGEHRGVALWAWKSGVTVATVDERLVLGNEAGVRLAIDVAQGDEDSLSDDERALSLHRAALAEVEDGPLVISTGFPRWPEGVLDGMARDLSEEGGWSTYPPLSTNAHDSGDERQHFEATRAALRKLEGGALSLSAEGAWTLSITGDPEALELVAAGYEASQDRLVAELKEALEEAVAREVGSQVMGLLFVQHKLQDMQATTTWEQDEQVLIARQEGAAGGSSVAMLIGVAALTGVVAYLTVLHRTTDAVEGEVLGPVHRVRLQDPVTATLEQAKVETVQMQMQRVASALEMRYAVDGSYPTALDVLVEENMLSNARALEDPWGRRLQYRLTVADGQEWRLCSMGPDRRAGTADDVCHAD